MITFLFLLQTVLKLIEKCFVMLSCIQWFSSFMLDIYKCEIMSSQNEIS